LLRRGAAAVLTGTLAGVAGCSAPALEVDGSPDVPYYATWAPAPDRLVDDSGDRGERPASTRWYPFRARQFGDLAAYHERRGSSFENTALYRDGKAHPVLDVDPGEAGMELRAGGRGVSVLETDLLEDDIVEAYRTPERDGPVTEPFEPVGEYDGYRLLAAPDGNWVVGVDGGAVVEAFASAAPDLLGEKRGVVEAVVDARAGEGRYTAAGPTLERLVSRLGTGMIVAVDPPATGTQSDAGTGEDPVASGVAYTDAETDNARQVLVFRSEAAADGFSVTRSADESGSWSDASASRDGRVVTVSGTHHPV
jgi:hypothetical protein